VILSPNGRGFFRARFKNTTGLANSETAILWLVLQVVTRMVAASQPRAGASRRILLDGKGREFPPAPHSGTGA
jgi:hypothetical protein